MPTTIQRLALRHPGGRTPILIGDGVWKQARAVLRPWVQGRSLFVFTSPRVRALHGEQVEPIAALARRVEWIELPEGEPAKRAAVALAAWRRMVLAGADRDSRVLAFGGGSVGDLAGFVAACLFRGVGWAQGPTTYLAQVDAAIGGKTAIDLPEAKNGVGALHQPDFVVCDPGLLDTLPAAELRSGLVEAVKVALACDARAFARLERAVEDLRGGDGPALARSVRDAVRLKIRVVESDPSDRGERLLLNLGHTLGHALETVLGYKGLRHGEAVLYGLLFILRPAVRRGLDPVAASRVRSLLERLTPPPIPTGARNVERVLSALTRDKKARSGRPRWVIPVALGRAQWGIDLPLREVRADLERFLRDPWAEAV